MPLDSAIRLGVGVVYGLAVLCCLGAFGFVVYRFHQMSSLEKVSALVLKSGPSVHILVTPNRRPSGGDSVSPMYSAEALVQYEFRGQEYTVVARHDVSVSSRRLQERLTRNWKPGNRIRVRIDPSKPDRPLAGIALNWNTFTPSIALLFAAALLFGTGYGLRRLMDYMLANHPAPGG